MSIEYTTEIVNHSRVIVECAFETCSRKAKRDFAWTESEPLDPQAQSWMDDGEWNGGWVAGYCPEHATDLEEGSPS